MDDKTQQTLMGLLGDMVGAIKGLREDIAKLHSDVDVTKKVLGENLVDILEALKLGSMEKAAPQASPDVKIKRKRRTKAEIAADNAKAECNPTEKAVWDKLKAEYGEDFPRPVIVSNKDNTVTVNGIIIGPAQLQAIFTQLQENPAATSSEIAEEIQLPVEAVCLVQIMIDTKK